MDHLSLICDDILNTIIKYLKIIDLIHIKEISHYFDNKLSDDNFNRCVYENTSTTSFDIDDKLYLRYDRGKSYNPNIQYTDLEFKTKSDEKVLIYKSFSNSNYDDLCGPIILTIDINLQYSVYVFTSEVDIDYEFTPDHYGWDDNDLDIRVLMYQNHYLDIADIKSFEISTSKKTRCYDKPYDLSQDLRKI